MNSFKSKVPYLRDVYLAYLIDGAPRAEGEGYPVIPPEFCFEGFPGAVAQWDQRSQVKDPEHTAMSFYCKDECFQPVLSDPQAYVDKLRKYQCVIGMDCSPFDNMPLVVQRHQIWLNLAITYYYGSQGIKVIPNVRIGGDATLDSLASYPKHAVIAIGTNGFVKSRENRQEFMLQTSKAIEELEPAGVVAYGPAESETFLAATLRGIPVREYESFMHARNASRRQKKGGDPK